MRVFSTLSIERHIKWLPHFIISLAGVTLAIYIHSILLKKGIPDSSFLPLVILMLLGTGFLFLVLLILSRCSQLICRAHYHKIRSYLSLTFLPIFLLWMYVATQRSIEEPIVNLVFMEIPTEVVYLLLVLLTTIIFALISVWMLRQQDKQGNVVVNRPLGKISGHLLMNIILVILLLAFGFKIYDRCVLHEIQEDVSRYTIDGKTRNVWTCPIPSEIVFRLESPSESVLHSGFGVTQEMFQNIPHSAAYEITISSQHQPPQRLVYDQVDPASAVGWVENSLDTAAFSDEPLQLRMKVYCEDSSFFLDTLNLCRYYLRLICIPSFYFDVSHRLALWIAPKVATKRKPQDTNVILIGIDTLRSDHVSFRQYPQKTVPHIDRLAQTGAAFENCLSVAPWTLPSFFSIMTSTYPSVHLYGTKVLWSRGRMARFRGVSLWTIGTISPDYRIKTLAEILREEDYYTAAFVNNYFLSVQFEFDRGFDEFNPYSSTAEKGIDQVLPWLERHKEGKFFLFIHFMDPHHVALFGMSQKPDYFGNTGDRATRTEIDAYDQKIRFCDEQIGRLMESLKEAGLAQDTLVVVTADHGEEFSDHGGYGHGHSVYNEVLLVPLIFHLPRWEEDRRILPERVTTLDIAPTILQILGLPLPTYYQGKSLMPLIHGNTISSQPIFAECVGSGHEKKAVFQDDYKLIYTTNVNSFEFYNLKDDPTETENLIGTLLDVEYRMREVLESFLMQSNSGIQVMIKPRSDLQTYKGTLSTTSTFTRVTPWFLTKPAVFQTSQDSKVIRFKLEDTDEANGFAFDVVRSDATIKLELTQTDNQAPTKLYLGSSTANPGRSPIAFDKSTLQALSTPSGPDIRAEGIHVWLKKGGRASRPVQIDADAKEKLEALGYLD